MITQMFRETLPPSELGAWCHESSIIEHDTFIDAASEVVDAFGSIDKLPMGVDVPLAFASDITIRFLGEENDHDGCAFYGFLIRTPAVEVLSCIEDDATHAIERWRGDQAAMQHLACELRIFQGALI